MNTRIILKDTNSPLSIADDELHMTQMMSSFMVSPNEAGEESVHGKEGGAAARAASSLRLREGDTEASTDPARLGITEFFENSQHSLPHAMDHRPRPNFSSRTSRGLFR
jgi:hypothetical protein